MHSRGTGVRARGLRRDSGQGLTEYIIVVALIAIASIGIVSVLGSNLRQLFGGATAATSGQVNVTMPGLQSGQQQANAVKGLGNFGQN